MMRIIDCILPLMGIIGMILVIIGGLEGEQSLLCGIIGGVLGAISFLFDGGIDIASLFLVFSLAFLYDLGKLRMEWLAKLSIILACILALTPIILGRIGIIGILTPNGNPSDQDKVGTYNKKRQKKPAIPQQPRHRYQCSSATHYQQEAHKHSKTT